MKQRVMALIIALLLVLPFGVPAQQAQLVDECRDYSQLFSRSGDWEMDPETQDNPYNPHPQLGLPAFGKATAYKADLVYQFEGLNDFVLRIFCANQRGAQLVTPDFQYPPDDPLVYGILLEVSADGESWESLSYAQTEIGKVGNDYNDGYETYMVEYKLVPEAPLVSGLNYLKIINRYNIPWGMFICR